MIVLWIDSPDDVAHGICRFACDLADPRKRLCDFIFAIVHTQPGDLTEYCNLRQTRADVIVEIGSDLRPQSLDSQDARQPNPMSGICRRCEHEEQQQSKPPLLRQWRGDAKPER